MTEAIISSSTKDRITNDSGSVQFPCPACSESTVVRTTKERKLAIKYKCEKCGFTGPN